MRFSVYRYDTKLYDVYDDGKGSPTHAGTPPIVTLGNDIGELPEGAAWRVPMGAKKVGTSSTPQGRIASMGGIGSSSIGTLGIAAILGYVAWRALK